VCAPAMQLTGSTFAEAKVPVPARTLLDGTALWLAEHTPAGKTQLKIEFIPVPFLSDTDAACGRMHEITTQGRHSNQTPYLYAAAQ